MVILRATSILGGQKEDKEMMCSITHYLGIILIAYIIHFALQVILTWNISIKPPTTSTAPWGVPSVLVDVKPLRSITIRIFPLKVTEILSQVYYVK
jgi:hypothetical protein